MVVKNPCVWIEETFVAGAVTTGITIAFHLGNLYLWSAAYWEIVGPQKQERIEYEYHWQEDIAVPGTFFAVT
jgi:hypothetical protein